MLPKRLHYAYTNRFSRYLAALGILDNGSNYSKHSTKYKMRSKK